MFIEVHSTYSGADMKWEEHLIINRKKIEKILDSVGYKYEVLPSMYQGAGYRGEVHERRREGSGRVRNHGVGVDERSVDRDWILGLAEFAVSCGHRKAKSEVANVLVCNSDTLHVFKDSKTN